MSIFTLEHLLHSGTGTLHSLKVLDLEDNDLMKLTDVLEALKPIETLRAVILEGNPCSVSIGQCCLHLPVDGLVENPCNCTDSKSNIRIIVR